MGCAAMAANARGAVRTPDMQGKMPDGLRLSPFGDIGVGR